MNLPAVIIGTIFIILFSWFLSIKYKRYHGIARFFAFESVFILVLLNHNDWFADPFSPYQIISWILLFLSLYVVVTGYLLLKEARSNPTLISRILHMLVKSGIYGYIRHPPFTF